MEGIKMASVKKTDVLTSHSESINRYHFTGEIELLQGLHIGSGRGNEVTDALVIRDAKNNPIIPGSSLRGVFRANLERILMGLYEADATQLWACQLYEAELPSQKVCVGNSVHAASVVEIGELQKKKEEKGGNQNVWNSLAHDLCDSCKLFGAGTFYASKIRFVDLKLITPNPQIVIRHGVGIHRDTGTAADGVKYDKEVVEAGAKFRFEAIAENLMDNDLMLLAIGFSQMIHAELVLGGSTGRGLGGIKLKDGLVSCVHLNKKEEAIPYLLEKKYLQAPQKLEDFTQIYLDQLLKPSQEGGIDAQTNS
ncbi:MAG: CRISPR-associated RAMP protein Csx7 [Bacteroidales bacterium]